MGPRFRRLLLCALVLLAVAENSCAEHSTSAENRATNTTIIPSPTNEAKPPEEPTTCTKEKEQECARNGQVCDDKEGKVKCIAKPHEEPTTCTKEKEQECARNGQVCDDKEGKVKCIAKPPEEPTTCTKEKEQECARNGQVCDDKEGKVKCIAKPPEEPTTCTKEKEQECARNGEVCDDTEGKVKCIAKPPEEPTTCTKEKGQECARNGEVCDDTEGKVKCIAKPPAKPTTCTEEKKQECDRQGKVCDDAEREVKCIDTCPQEKVTECEKIPYKKCRIHKGKFECVCQQGLKETDDGQCKIGRKVTVRFKIPNSNSRPKRETVNKSTKPCNMDEQELVKMVKENVPNVDESTIVCNGEDVSFDVFVQNNEEEANVTDTFAKCGQLRIPECKLGDVTFESGEVNPANQCKDLEAIAKDFGMECKYNESHGTTFSCDNAITQAIGSATLDGMPFEVCKPRPCNETCQGDERKHCVLESCVCKPQYKYDLESRQCKNICEAIPNLCHREAECVPGVNYQNFYCRCPPKRTGPQCQRENKPLQSAQLNIVIVGVVLSSLLLMCFVVSASIISRLKKKLEGPNFKKDPERNPQRELRGYDGPYRASDPASLHRERDYTSL
ncbi:neurogenic locus notch homolog protein 1-like isoform X11 [Dermacentor silvarum]|uniref:neurogenic locus notch homolog protein 1-like isoform X10 n=1 Tax=Dermacentor silvarum TaxID=543639 RepID=UPI00210128BE|nr:neurogenic locus notch homolog protein 1-like isoform X10 [Dermacentor silvarum]XP_049525629.1 neurogenic locus notch homolog protein 1-like isoform X11 [Dermacentor silvarum]